MVFLNKSFSATELFAIKGEGYFISVGEGGSYRVYDSKVISVI